MTSAEARLEALEEELGAKDRAIGAHATLLVGLVEQRAENVRGNVDGRRVDAIMN